MAIRLIAPPTQHGDTDRVVLDGATYELEWRWNARAGRWWLRLSDDSGQIVYTPVVAGYPLLLSVTGTRRPAGELMVLDTIGAGRDPALRDFASDFEVVYTDEADLPEGY